MIHRRTLPRHLPHPLHLSHQILGQRALADDIEVLGQLGGARGAQDNSIAVLGAEVGMVQDPAQGGGVAVEPGRGRRRLQLRAGREERGFEVVFLVDLPEVRLFGG